MDTQIEGNKLIAVFMGYIRKDRPTPSGGWKHWDIKPFGYFEDEELLYHSDWSWLMPVVEKIYRLGYDFTLEFDTCKGVKMYWAHFFTDNDPITSAGKESAIELVYNAVVKIIEYHNTTNP